MQNTANLAGVPVDDTVTYAEISDVEALLRSYDIGTNTNLTQSQVTSFLEKRTREVEKKTVTAFRELDITDLELEVTPTTEQRRERNRISRHAVSRQSFSGRVANTTERWITVELPHTRIRNVDSIEAYTAYDRNGVTLDADDYIINKREGTLRVDYRAFKPTQSGRFADDHLKDARINISYSYGYTRIEEDISEAVAKLVVYDIVNSDAFGDVLPDEDQFVSPQDFSRRIKQEAEDTMDQYS